jgi:uncharacterized membrane protein
VEVTCGRHWDRRIRADGVASAEARISAIAGGGLAGLGFSLYLAHIEADILGVWCIYCVASLGVISLMSVLVLGTVIVQLVRRPSAASLEQFLGLDTC